MPPAFPGARFTDDLDEVLADDTVDAVALATPVPLHAEMAVRVLEAGKHCFVEKPMATDRGRRRGGRGGRRGERSHA